MPNTNFKIELINKLNSKKAATTNNGYKKQWIQRQWPEET